MFEYSILFVIILNSLLLGIADFSEVDPETYDLAHENSTRNRILFYAEFIFGTIYTVEALMKVRLSSRAATKDSFFH